ETVLDASRAVVGDAPILRMNHLEAMIAVPDFAEAAQPGADGKLVDWRAVEVKEAQHQGLLRVVGDGDAQLRAVAESALDRFDTRFDLRRFAGMQVADRG